MEENRMVKRVFEGHTGGSRKTGRPRKRWLDNTEEDLRLMKDTPVEVERLVGLGSDGWIILRRILD
jgi:hypothetical protein